MRRQQGFALIYLLLVTVIALLLVGSLLGLARQQLFVSELALRSDKAIYAAQAGLAACIDRFRSQPDWTGGFSAATVPGGTSTYSVRFAVSPASPGPDDSVNNLQGTSPADSYLGPATVPPRTALLVIRGQEAGYTRVMEAFVGGGDPTLANFAMNASASVHLQGNTSVDGLVALNKADTIPAGIHSNAPTGANEIEWTGPGICNITGQLSASSSDPAAIRLDAGAVLGMTPVNNQPRVTSPSYNITDIVQAHRNDPSVSLVPGSSGVISLPAGDYYVAGNQNLAGDLILESGAHLYVRGDLLVNGSISGSGVVAVTGDTTFFGSAQVSSSESDYLALLSQGNVLLKGFNGTAYLNSLAAQSAAGNLAGDPTGEFNQSWAGVQAAERALVPLLQRAASDPAGIVPADNSLMDQQMAKLGDWSGTTPLNPKHNLGILQSHLPTRGPTANFLRQRLAIMNDLFRPSDRSSNGTANNDLLIGRVIYACFSGQPANTADQALLTTWLQNFDNGTYSAGGPPGNPYYSATAGGAFDFFQSVVCQAQPSTQAYKDVMMSHFQSTVHTISRFNEASFGAASFQGLVYTHGALVAQNDLAVLGGVVALDDGSQQPARVGGIDVKPGEIYLADTHLTYVKAMFNNGTYSMAGAGLVAPLTWHFR
ncbi:MAG: hypothetical protein U0931_37275 [Vulcanimicrobiota bacterium]